MTTSIVFTGGGTAGHVTPNLALIKALQNEGWDIAYVGSNDGIERTMIEGINIPFYGVSSGKLRRYFSFKNFIDPFKILWGIGQSFFYFWRKKPSVVFSKGGFVAFPVVVGAWLNRIPVIAHESDMSPGLANRLSFPFVNIICLTFDAAKKHFKDQAKVRVTGTPIRPELFRGDAQRAISRCGFSADKPTLLIIGGSLGAGSINTAVREALPTLLQQFQIIHLCGKGKVDETLANTPGYCQLEYANEDLADYFALASIVISRSGANSLYEILALGKPHVLIPLSTKISRGDQIQNARFYQKAGISTVIDDEALTADSLLQAVQDVAHRQQDIVQKIQELDIKSATDTIVQIIKEQAHVESPGTA